MKFCHLNCYADHCIFNYLYYGYCSFVFTLLII